MLELCDSYAIIWREQSIEGIIPDPLKSRLRRQLIRKHKAMIRVLHTHMIGALGKNPV